MNPIIEKLPPWYHGDRLRESLALEIPCSELSGHVLDEIIDEILNNPKNFQWEGRAGLSSCLGVNTRCLKDRLWVWNTQKMKFANIDPNTPAKDLNSAIRKIVGGSNAERCWQRYRSFVNSEGCPLPVDPAILFESLYPETTFKDRLHSELSGWSDFRRVEVGAGIVREG
jgi:hypothetical protein